MDVSGIVSVIQKLSGSDFWITIPVSNFKWTSSFQVSLESRAEVLEKIWSQGNDPLDAAGREELRWVLPGFVSDLSVRPLNKPKGFLLPCPSAAWSNIL